MKKYFVAIVVLLTLNIVVLSSVQAKEKKVSHSLTLTNPDKAARLEVSLMHGKITVEGYKGKSIEIEAVVRELSKETDEFWHERIDVRVDTGMRDETPPKKPSIKGLKKVEKTMVNLDIEERNNRVSIESHARRQDIELVLRVPFNTNVELELNRGNGIFVNNVHGSIEIESAAGPLSAKGVRGSIVAESSSSNITVIYDTFNLEKPSSLTVHRGNIDVTIPKKSSAQIEVKNYEGEIYSGLDTPFQSVDKIEKGKDGKRQQISIGGTMQAKVNGGKQKLLLNTYRGDIFVRTK
ncbi:MAG: DUF4097 domain-containing protein [Kangiellaceae bacterium]|nr:DUF4097 domain-containing protein [Kangiellaceae bacterium]